MTNLAICNKAFFTTHLLNPFDKSLSKQNQALAFLTSFFIGIASLGLAHLISFLILKCKKIKVLDEAAKKEPAQQKAQDLFKERVKKAPIEIAPSKVEKLPDLKPQMNVETLFKVAIIAKENANLPKALEYFTAAAEKGHIFSALEKAYLHLKKETPKDNELAFASFKVAAKGDNLTAQYELGRCYEQGNGTDKDMTKAIEWWKKAAKMGDESSLLILQDHGALDDATELAFHTIKAQDGVSHSMDKLGTFYFKAGQLEEGLYWTEQAAQQHVPSALNNLGLYFLNGMLNLPKDETTAKNCFQDAMNNGNGAAAYNLANLQNDPVEKFYLFSKSYHLGYLDAAIPLAEKCLERNDTKSALTYLEKAAENNVPHAIGMLGVIKAKEDPVEGIKLLNKAKELGALKYASNIFELKKTHAYLYDRLEVLKHRTIKDTPESHYQYGMALKLAGKAYLEELKKAASKGHGKACMEIADEYFSKSDTVKGIKYLQRAVKDNISLAAYNLALFWEIGNEHLVADLSLAVENAQKAHDLGHPKAKELLEKLTLIKQGQDALEKVQYSSQLPNTEEYIALGRCYKEGKGVVKDTAKAAEYFNKATQLNSNEALYWLAKIAAEEKDMAKAALNYQEALDSSDDHPYAPAALELASYYTSLGQPLKAEEYLKQGHQLELAEATYRLGCYYIPHKIDEAKKFLWEASEAGHKEALQKLASL